MQSLSYHRFGQVSLKLQSNNVTEENLSLVNTGDITIQREDRSYNLHTSAMGCAMDDKGIIDITLQLGTFCNALEAYPECKFDLLEDDLTHVDLFTTIVVSSADSKIDLTFISGQIEVDFGTKPQEYIQINATDKAEQKEFLKLNRIAEQISTIFNGLPVKKVIVDDEFGCVTATVDGAKNVDCGWIEDYFINEVDA